MRQRLVLPLLAVLAAAPFVAADACAPTCTLLAHTQAFVTPVAAVTSGSTVLWQTLDVGHTATDRVGGCFHTSFSEAELGRALLVVADGALYASGEGGPLEACASAQALPDGSFLLDYVCLFHPSMEGKLLVR